MGTPTPETRRRALALKARGLTDKRVAAELGYSVSEVRRLLLRAQADAAQALPQPTERELALERGRFLAMCKVAAREWVLPKGSAR